MNEIGNISTAKHIVGESLITKRIITKKFKYSSQIFTYLSEVSTRKHTKIIICGFLCREICIHRYAYDI